MGTMTNKDEALKAVIYDNYMGFPYAVTAIGNRWWVTTPGEELLPLDDFIGDDEIGFCYLCEAGGKVGALTLAKMLGKALTNPEDCVDKVLKLRVESLKRLGVTLDVKVEPLELELEILKHQDGSFRHGKYSDICHLNDNYCEQLFDIDSFESEQDAERWADYYFMVLKSVGFKLRIIKKHKV